MMPKRLANSFNSGKNTAEPLNKEANRESVLEIEQLKTWYPIQKGIFQRTVGYLKAVDGISFSVYRGETLGIVGESGSGKSTLGRTIMRLEQPTSGRMLFDGQDFTFIKGKRLIHVRRQLQMVFQDPYASLNPRMTVEQLLMEPLIVHRLYTKAERLEKTKQLLTEVGLSKETLKRYPHQFSGGQRQRLSIARALMLKPQLLIADEPVSALDLSVQAQIIELLKTLQQKLHLTTLFISHDLSVVKYVSDRVGVIYMGSLMELAPKEKLFEQPLHPYTQALISAVPVAHPKHRREYHALKGTVPNPAQPPIGCPFHTRCPQATKRCVKERPTLLEATPGHHVACHLYTT